MRGVQLPQELAVPRSGLGGPHAATRRAMLSIAKTGEIGRGTGRRRRRLGVNGERTQRRTSSEWMKQRKKKMPGAMLRHDPARPIATPPRTLPQGVRIGSERRPRKMCRSSPLPEALRRQAAGQPQMLHLTVPAMKSNRKRTHCPH